VAFVAPKAELPFGKSVVTGLVDKVVPSVQIANSGEELSRYSEKEASSSDLKQRTLTFVACA
jgi:hypothetical protein